MHDNPQVAPVALEARTFAGDHALPGHVVLTIEGRDAVAFAQAQVMNDVLALADGHWQWNGWLTPKGRVVALFALLRFSAESVWLVVADADADALADALKRFVFRSKVVIEARLDLRVLGAFEPPTEARANAIATLGDKSVELDVGGDGGARRLRVVRADPVDERGSSDAREDAQTRDAFATQWMAFDIAHGWPRLAAGQFDAWTPQQLSLDRLRAYSVKKGCYPGQEIVARTHFLGKAKRGLMRLGCADALKLGEVIDDSDRPVGRFINAVSGEGLAVMPLDAVGPFNSHGAMCEVRPLLGGLER